MRLSIVSKSAQLFRLAIIAVFLHPCINTNKDRLAYYTS